MAHETPKAPEPVVGYVPDAGRHGWRIDGLRLDHGQAVHHLARSCGLSLLAAEALVEDARSRAIAEAAPNLRVVREVKDYLIGDNPTLRAAADARAVLAEEYRLTPGEADLLLKRADERARAGR